MDLVEVTEIRDRRRGEFPPKNTSRGFAEYARFIGDISGGTADLTGILAEASSLNRAWVDFGCGDGRALRSFAKLGKDLLDIDPPPIIGITANVTNGEEIPGSVIVSATVDEQHRLIDVVRDAQRRVGAEGVHLITGINSFYYLEPKAWALSLRDVYELLADGGSAFLDIYTQRDVTGQKYESLPNVDRTILENIARKAIPGEIRFHDHVEEGDEEKLTLVSMHFKK